MKTKLVILILNDTRAWTPNWSLLKKYFKKKPAAGGENFLIRYLGLGTSRLRYLRYPGAGRGGGNTLKYLGLGT